LPAANLWHQPLTKGFFTALGYFILKHLQIHQTKPYIEPLRYITGLGASALFIKTT